MNATRKGTRIDGLTPLRNAYYCPQCRRTHTRGTADALDTFGTRDALYRDAHTRERAHTYTAILHGTRRITPNDRVPALFYATTTGGRVHYATPHTQAIRARECGRASGRARIGVSLGYCEACGVTRKEHTPNDGHTYRAAMGARVTGDVRTGTFGDSHNARVRALADTHTHARTRDAHTYCDVHGYVTAPHVAH